MPATYRVIEVNRRPEGILEVGVEITNGERTSQRSYSFGDTAMVENFLKGTLPSELAREEELNQAEAALVELMDKAEECDATASADLDVAKLAQDRTDKLAAVAAAEPVEKLEG